MTDGYSHVGLDEPKDTPHPEGQPLPEHFAHKGVESPSSRPNTASRYSHKVAETENAPEASRTDDQAKGDGVAPAGAKDAAAANGTNPPADSGTELTPDKWDAAIDAGRLDEVGAAVTKELRAMGASEAELGTAQNLCNLVSERRASPEWVAWGKSVLAWVRDLRKS